MLPLNWMTLHPEIKTDKLKDDYRIPPTKSCIKVNQQWDWSEMKVEDDWIMSTCQFKVIAIINKVTQSSANSWSVFLTFDKRKAKDNLW